MIDHLERPFGKLPPAARQINPHLENSAAVYCPSRNSNFAKFPNAPEVSPIARFTHVVPRRCSAVARCAGLLVSACIALAASCLVTSSPVRAQGPTLQDQITQHEQKLSEARAKNISRDEVSELNSLGALYRASEAKRKRRRNISTRPCRSRGVHTIAAAKRWLSITSAGSTRIWDWNRRRSIP